MTSFPVEQARAALSEGAGAGIKIAVIDSGIEASHPALGGITLADDLVFFEQDGIITAVEGRGEDAMGHGTAVAGILREIAPSATIGSFRILGCGVRKEIRAEVAREAVRLAMDKGYHILNCSFGMPEKVELFKSLLDDVYLRGVHLVAACNNTDLRIPENPGNFPSVITVNMSRNTDPTAIYYKPGNLVEFAMLGVNVQVAFKGGRTIQTTGSSFAAPRMTAMLARMLSVMPGVTTLEAKSLLLRLAAPWDHNIRGWNVVYTV